MVGPIIIRNTHSSLMGPIIIRNTQSSLIRNQNKRPGDLVNF